MHRAPSTDNRPDFLVKLGLALPCSPEDVKQAYLERAKTMHPDAGGTVEGFVALQEAYEKAAEYTRFFSGRSNWLSSSIERYVEQQGLLEGVLAVGGGADLEGVDWLRDEIGDDFAQVLDRVVHLRLTGDRVDDATIDMLVRRASALASLREIDFSNSRVTDAGAARLKAFPTLLRLDLSHSRVTPAGLEVIESLPHLEWLGARGIVRGWFSRRRLQRTRPGVEVVT
jgi:hypothetical protein